jgi:CelD/BcsL family acetyltransferase involved in cellulose biosynthesis
MTVYKIDPLTDPRWEELTARHPSASVFHSTGWLRALRLTYGYEPVAYTLSPPRSELANAVVFARIQSWVTGQRLVSLPFSDHCELLVDSDSASTEIMGHACWEARKNGADSVEIRPITFGDTIASQSGFGTSKSFILHRVDLSPTLDVLHRSFHKDCVQRKIRRAEKEQLRYEDGRSEKLLQDFFALMLKTRRKHQLPPQPIAWFRCLADCLGDQLHIRMAFNGDTAVAAILTIGWKDALVYKYGCSDAKFSNLGGTPMVFWKAIQAAKNAGLGCFDLGRSDLDNAGLLDFKDHWAGKRTPLTYWRQPAPNQNQTSRSEWSQRLAGQIFKRTPDRLLEIAGKILYPHIG